jgi:orotate phosphoribosyltransferase
MADRLSLPFVYVRDKPKGHGRQNRIEGHLEPGQRVLVVEDLISTGGSSLKAIEALREAGANIVGLVAIFSYGFEQAVQNFLQADCPFATLTNYNALIEVAIATGYIQNTHFDTLQAWRQAPQLWGVD